MQVDTLTITFECDLNLSQVPQFRGAVLSALPAEKSVIYHNHQADGYRYSYPLVQYKVIEGKAAILFIDKGINESSSLISACNRTIQFGSQPVQLTVSSLRPASTELSLSDEVFRYRLNDWLPVNENNMPQYRACQTEEQLHYFLSAKLTGHVLSFAKSLGHYFEGEVQCEVACIRRRHLEECKHVRMIAFDVEFLSNVSLPDFIGLGKHPSFGYGKIKKIQ